MRSRTTRFVGVVLVMWWSFLATARAQPTEADKEGARIHFKAGEQYYLSAHYAQAISEFREAYRLSKAPALLYNIAQAYEKLGDLENQREFLQRYVDSGKADPAEVPALKDKVKDLDAQIAARKNPGSTPTPVKPPPPVVIEPTPSEPFIAAPPPVDEGPRPYKTWKWIALGAGGGSLILSMLFLADAGNMNSQIEEAVTDPPGAYTERLQEAYSRGQRDNALGAVFGIAGVALVTTGIVLYIMDKPSAAPHTTFVPVISPTEIGAAAVVSF